MVNELSQESVQVLYTSLILVELADILDDELSYHSYVDGRKAKKLESIIRHLLTQEGVYLTMFLEALHFHLATCTFMI